MFHLLAEREEGKKGKWRQIYDGKPTEISCAMAATACPWDKQQGLGVVPLRARAVSSHCRMFIPFTFPKKHCCLLSPARDTTRSRLLHSSLHKADYCTPLSKAALLTVPSILELRICQERGREWRFFHSHTWNCRRKTLEKWGFGQEEPLGGNKGQVPAGTPLNRLVLSGRQLRELPELLGYFYFGKGGMFSKREMDLGGGQGGFGGTKDRGSFQTSPLPSCFV